MLSHVCAGISDFGRAAAFYARVLGELGLVQKFSVPERCFAGWIKPGEARPVFFITAPHDGGAATPGNGAMVAFETADRASVDRAHEAALAHGGSCEGKPGLRPHYHANYYGAYFRDPDGNKLCVCCHQNEGV